MLGGTRFGNFLLAVTLVLGILPIRPLVIALATDGPAAQGCLLHGPDCTCTAHCDRTREHSHQASEAAAKPAACHREPAGEAPLAKNVSTQPGDEAPPSTEVSYRAPQLASSGNLVALAYGSGRGIYVATSTNEGKDFPKPVRIAEAPSSL